MATDWIQEVVEKHGGTWISLDYVEGEVVITHLLTTPKEVGKKILSEKCM